MHFEAEIKARHEDGVLERVLRVCRHRGFEWQSFEAHVDNAIVRIIVRGTSERPLTLLLRQIEKLDETIAVSLREILGDLKFLRDEGEEDGYFAQQKQKRQVRLAPAPSR